jgi:hypothetical protein
MLDCRNARAGGAVRRRSGTANQRCIILYPLRLVSLVGALALAACAGGAEGPDLPPPDPPDAWRWVTQDDATATSKCIGDPKTPLCAVETIIACFTRDEGTLCGIAHRDTSVGPSRKYPGTPFKATKYRFLSAKRLAEEDISVYDRLACVGAWRPGNLRVEVREANCWRRESGYECKGYFTQEADLKEYIVRPSADRWNVVNWHNLGTVKRRLKLNGCYGA